MSVFKACIVVLLCAAYVSAIPPKIKELLPQELIDLIYSLRAGCAPKFGLTDADIESFDISSNTESKYKCYMQCLMLDANWMDPDGTIHYDAVLDDSHHVVRPILEAAFAKCRELPESTEECGKAYNFNACLAKADPKHYFLP